MVTMVLKSNRVRTFCVDLGGSRVKLAIVEDGRVVASEMFAVCASASETLAAVSVKGRELMSRHGGSFAGLAVAAAICAIAVDS